MQRNQIISSIKNLNILLILGSLTLLLFGIILSFFMSYKMYYSIVDMIIMLQNPIEKKLNPNTLGELFYIENNIATLAFKNDLISKELSDKLKALKKAQSIALQTQINPHFLFNTLQMINMSIMREQKKDTDSTRMISLLADLIRISYDTKEYLVSIHEEVNHIKKYIDLQKIKYKNRLDIKLSIEEQCLNYKTLKLILQPLVENSIVHGFSNKKGNWVIQVNIFLENNMLHLRVVDNGVGITLNKLSELQTTLKNTILQENNSIGLSNINQRIRLVFGDSYGVNISSNLNEGTCITLTLPLVNEDFKFNINEFS